MPWSLLVITHRRPAAFGMLSQGCMGKGERLPPPAVLHRRGRLNHVFYWAVTGEKLLLMGEHRNFVLGHGWLEIAT